MCGMSICGKSQTKVEKQQLLCLFFPGAQWFKAVFSSTVSLITSPDLGEMISHPLILTHFLFLLFDFLGVYYSFTLIAMMRYPLY